MEINPVGTGEAQRQKIREESPLSAHRDLLTELSAEIAGREPVRLEGDMAIFYRLPSIGTLRDKPELQDVAGGKIQWDGDGNLHLETEDRTYHITKINGDPEAALEFINSVRHLVEARRQKLAARANETMEIDGVDDRSSPTGPEGHLLRKYANLLDQLEHEHFRQRDRLQS